MNANPIYNIHLLAKKGDKVDGTDSKVKFFFDWSIMPKSRYKVSFTMLGARNLLKGENVCLLYIDLGNAKSYEPTGNNRLSTSNLLGHIFPNAVDGTNTSSTYLFSKKTCNSEIYLDSLPKSNEIVVEFLSSTAVQAPFLDDSDSPSPVGSNLGWIVSLSLEQLD
tara:strand:+ start:67 stop:561 length:495 start_codon:yes stop_codon:yes gene_type:complete